MPEAPEPEVTPSLDEVHQQEHVPELAEGAVPVHVDGPVNVRQLPTRGVTLRSLPLTTGAQPIMAADNRRASIKLLATTDVHYAFTAADCNVGAGMDWPAGAPLTLTYRDKGLWVKAAADGTVSVVIEAWAD